MPSRKDSSPKPHAASMKALPRRKGNIFVSIATPILWMPQ